MRSETFYKVVRPDLTSFHDPDYLWRIGGTHRPATPLSARASRVEMCTNHFLYASRTAPDALRTVARWPYRLLEVQGTPAIEDGDKTAFRQLKVIREVDLAECFGPNGAAVLTVLRQAESLTPQQAAAGAAARAAAVGDLIGQHGFTQDHYDTLTAPWLELVGSTP